MAQSSTSAPVKYLVPRPMMMSPSTTCALWERTSRLTWDRQWLAWSPERTRVDEARHHGDLSGHCHGRSRALPRVAKHTAPEGSLGQQGKEALDLIDP